LLISINEIEFSRAVENIVMRRPPNRFLSGMPWLSYSAITSCHRFAKFFSGLSGMIWCTSKHTVLPRLTFSSPHSNIFVKHIRFVGVPASTEQRAKRTHCGTQVIQRLCIDTCLYSRRPLIDTTKLYYKALYREIRVSKGVGGWGVVCLVCAKVFVVHPIWIHTKASDFIRLI
jgi:hypothetical protein